jgi:hypothetical protein
VVHKTDTREAWLEPVLDRHLGRVAAPKELWDRVRNPAERRSGNSMRRLAWASAAALFAITALWGLRANRDGGSANEALAVQALTRGPEHLQFRSENVAEIRGWVRASTGIDIPFTSSSKMVQLTGACAVKAGAPAAEVAFRVADRNAALIVTKMKSAPPGESRHKFLSSGTYQGISVSSWVMRGRLYTIAYAVAGDFHTACLLCHAPMG